MRSDWIYRNIVAKGVKNVRFWALMHPVQRINFEGIGSFGFADANTSMWAECKVIEDRYKVSEGYKITLQPINENFARQDYYQEDFESLLEKGYILEKKSENEHLEKVVNLESIGNGITVVTEGYIVVQ